VAGGSIKEEEVKHGFHTWACQTLFQQKGCVQSPREGRTRLTNLMAGLTAPGLDRVESLIIAADGGVVVLLSSGAPLLVD
jgi:hypothetical protein